MFLSLFKRKRYDEVIKRYLAVGKEDLKNYSWQKEMMLMIVADSFLLSDKIEDASRIYKELKVISKDLFMQLYVEWKIKMISVGEIKLLSDYLKVEDPEKKDLELGRIVEKLSFGKIMYGRA